MLLGNPLVRILRVIYTQESMRAMASLTIVSSVLTSEAISWRLALQPTESYEAGHPVDPRRHPHGPFRKQAFWNLQSQLPYSASLASHLGGLVGVLDSRREALAALRAITAPRFSCGLFVGDNERVAGFDIPADLIGWCSGILEISLDCYPPSSSIDAEEADTDEAEAPDTASEPREDLVFSYLASAADRPSLEPAHEGNDARSDQLLPRPTDSQRIIIASDLPENSEPSQHFHRVFDLLRIRRAGGVVNSPELICLFTTNRGTGSIVWLEIPILAQLTHLQAAFRINVYQAPSALRRLRQFH